jgi:hypothetical protein
MRPPLSCPCRAPAARISVLMGATGKNEPSMQVKADMPCRALGHNRGTTGAYQSSPAHIDVITLCYALKQDRYRQGHNRAQQGRSSYAYDWTDVAFIPAVGTVRAQRARWGAAQ